MLKSSESKRDILSCLVLALFIILIYWQVNTFKFVYYDDSTYVTERPQVMAGLTWEGFKWAMSATDAGFWHPLTWLSLMLDRELFGNNPGGYHWTNVILHTINTILLFFFLKGATKARLRSAFVALLFAVHPLHVESVAWVAQRKDLLCTLFGFASLWAYVKYTASPGWRSYAMMILFFILGLMSKPMIATFPFVMLLMDYWPLQRLTVGEAAGNGGEMMSAALHNNIRPFRSLLLEKVPLMLLSVMASILVVVTEHKAQAITSLEVLSISNRKANALESYAKYLVMMVWPTNLTFVYPHPVTIPVVKIIGALILMSAITVITLYTIRRKPYLFTGWFWYVGTLLPVIGIIQVGPHALADRYTYVPLIGLFIIVVWGMIDLTTKWKYKEIVLWIIGSLTVIGLSLCTWVQVDYWRNSVALFEHALKVTKGNYIAMNNLGFVLIGQGEFEKGASLIREAIKIKPKYGLLYHNVGIAMNKQGRYEESIEYLRKALKLSFDKDETHRALGEAYLATGRDKDAIDAFRNAINIKSENLETHYGLAKALNKMGRNKEATHALRVIIASEPKNMEVRKKLLMILMEMKNYESVAAEGEEAMAVAKDLVDMDTHNMMGVAYQKLGQREKSKLHFKAAHLLEK